MPRALPLGRDIRAEEGTDDTIMVRMAYWTNTTFRALTRIRITKAKVIRAGGSESDWDALDLLATNSSDCDDVVELLAGSTWGTELLWGSWHAYWAK